MSKKFFRVYKHLLSAVIKGGKEGSCGVTASMKNGNEWKQTIDLNFCFRETIKVTQIGVV